VPPEEVIRELRARDDRDRNRADSPLRPAADAILLDSTHMTLEQAVEAAAAIVTRALAAQPGHAATGQTAPGRDGIGS
jgi:cytidylate kinase